MFPDFSERAAQQDRPSIERCAMASRFDKAFLPIAWGSLLLILAFGVLIY